jgi:flagellar assembly protein FliH
MAKAVFRPSELTAISDKVIIEPPASFADAAHLSIIQEPESDLDETEEYTGPTAEDLRREAEDFRIRWEEEKAGMIAEAEKRARDIILDAQEKAMRESMQITGEAEAKIAKAEEDSENILSKANKQAQEIKDNSEAVFESERKEAQENGRKAGYEEGYAKGMDEVKRLVERTQTMLERAQDKRADILKEAEQEIVDLVLLIARKVIKVISENQREVIIENVKYALRNVRSKGNIIIRVNMADLKLATEHTKEFIALVEGAKSVQVVEDSNVDSGGCIIETDFGEIDARISSQLSELENKILEMSPYKSDIPQEVRPQRELNVPAALSSLNNLAPKSTNDKEPISQQASAALTMSAALAAYAALTSGQEQPAKT